MRSLLSLAVTLSTATSGQNLCRASRNVALLSAGTALGIAAYSAANGSLRVDPTLVPLLVLYPSGG